MMDEFRKFSQAVVALPSSAMPSLGMGGATRLETAEMQATNARLDQANSEILELRTELSRKEADTDRIIVSLQKAEDMIKLFQSDQDRVQEMSAMGAGETSQFWEDKYRAEEKARKSAEAMKKADEQKIVELQAQIADLGDRLNSQVAQQIAERGDADGESDGPQYSKIDSPTTFLDRLKLMQTGEKLFFWQNEKFQQVVAKLSVDCRELTFAVNEKKKPFETVPIGDIEKVVYPMATQIKRAKKGQDLGKDYMKFGVSTRAHKTFTIMAVNTKQLTTWFLGLQNLACKPGQSILHTGGFMWQRTRSKLQSEATVRGVSPLKMLSEVFEKMLPPEEDIVLDEVNGAPSEPGAPSSHAAVEAIAEGEEDLEDEEGVVADAQEQEEVADIGTTDAQEPQSAAEESLQIAPEHSAAEVEPSAEVEPAEEVEPAVEVESAAEVEPEAEVAESAEGVEQVAEVEPEGNVAQPTEEVERAVAVEPVPTEDSPIISASKDPSPEGKGP